MSLSNQKAEVKRAITDRNKPIGFGRYAKETAQDILDNHPEYIMWLDENTDIEIASDIVAEADENSHPNHEFKNWSIRNEVEGYTDPEFYK